MKYLLRCDACRGLSEVNPPDRNYVSSAPVGWTQIMLWVSATETVEAERTEYVVCADCRPSASRAIKEALAGLALRNG